MQENKIPKIIHYCWFGENNKTLLVKKCLKTWKKYCSDWEIKEWNNEDLKTCTNKYALEAASVKKWAFVSDYFRLKALKEYGGIYLDTDVEITSPLDEFLNCEMFIGQENYNGFFNIGTATIGAIKNQSLINELLTEYENIDFIMPDGSYNMMTNPLRFCNYLSSHYDIPDLRKEQGIIELKENCFIYPWWYFCLAKKKEKNYTIHHFSGSWRDGLITKLIKHFKKNKK